VDILVAGGHGKIGLRLLRLLAADGHRARGLIRSADQSEDLEAVGAEPVVLDLERDDVTAAARGADAIVFAAGAGPGSGPERKRTVDLGGALKMIDAAKQNGVRRYVIVSSMGADDPPPGNEAMAPYLQAKAAADAALVESGLDYTIVRPGGLTDEPGTGLIDAARSWVATARCRATTSPRHCSRCWRRRTRSVRRSSCWRARGRSARRSRRCRPGRERRPCLTC
jgi:uncharacterized protein YbjT (DUF2867 family)